MLKTIPRCTILRPVPLLLLIAALSACGESTPTDVAPPPVDEPEVGALVPAQDALVVSLNATAAVSVRALDLDEADVDVPIEWSVADRAIATIDANGVVTPLAVGSTEIVATVRAEAHGGRADVTTAVSLTTVDVATGVVIVPATTLLGDPELLSPGDDSAGESAQLRVLLSSAAPTVRVADRILLSDWSHFGEVRSVSGGSSGSTVDFALSGLDGFFDEARLHFEVDLDEGTSLPFEAPTLQFAAGGPWASGGPSLSIVDSLVARALKGFEHELGKFKCSASVEASMGSIQQDVEPDLDFLGMKGVFDQTVVSGIAQNARFYVEAGVRADLDGTIEWEESLKGRVDCRLPLKTPMLEEPPFVVAVPSGVGFVLEANAKSTDAVVTLSGYIQSTWRVGLEFSASQIVTPIAEADHDFDQLDVDIEFPSLTDPAAARGDVMFELFGYSTVFGGVGVGIQAGLYKQVDDFRLGARLRTDVAGAERQLRDDSFSASGSLSGFFTRVPEDPLMMVRAQAGMLGVVTVLDVLQALGVVDVKELFTIDRSLPISTTPSGALTASGLQAEVGDTIELALDLTSETFLGAYQVSGVTVYRLKGAGLSTEATPFAVFDPEPGQTQFVWSWVPAAADAEEGIVRLAPVVESVFFPVASFQVDAPLEIEVEVPSDIWVARRSPDVLNVSASASTYREEDGLGWVFDTVAVGLESADLNHGARGEHRYPCDVGFYTLEPSVSFEGSQTVAESPSQFTYELDVSGVASISVLRDPDAAGCRAQSRNARGGATIWQGFNIGSNRALAYEIRYAYESHYTSGGVRRRIDFADQMDRSGVRVTADEPGIGTTFLITELEGNDGEERTLSGTLEAGSSLELDLRYMFGVEASRGRDRDNRFKVVVRVEVIGD